MALAHAAALTRDVLQSIITHQRFRPVFQPIFELESRAIVGYEALTRFDVGPPDLVFAAARAAGLHSELESVTLAVALKAAGTLPAAARLHVNVSADLVLAHEPLAGLLRDGGWRVALELTEDVEITDYAAFRAALARLGPHVELAVDDTGSGFASLRHLVELAPAYVKLDRFLISGIGRSTAKQALVAGLSYFAMRTGAVLIAEAIENAASIKALVNLGVSFGQGFYTAPPMSAGELARGIQPPVDWPITADRSLRLPPMMPPSLPIERVVNVGARLGPALRSVGIETFADLVAAGAVEAWRRLGRHHPALATPPALRSLQASIHQIRPSMLSASERAALDILAQVEGGRTLPDGE